MRRVDALTCNPCHPAPATHRGRHLFRPVDIDLYFQRFGYFDRLIEAPPEPGLEMVVVIPCHDEPDLIACLDSLWTCRPPVAALEIIVVINSSETAPDDLRTRNQKSWSEATDWIHQHDDKQFRVHLLHIPDLPKKHAGVGLARKIGMDEAVRRLSATGHPEGILICLDADCTCDPDYLVAIEACFRDHPEAPGCSIYFEHPLEGLFDPAIYTAVAPYELHLRYYVHGLRFARFPHAHHTVGSSMAVRANAYCRQGGMNRRKAGEDFYFLQKIIPLGAFRDITKTCVRPSPRPSHRVPFGTGKAVRDGIESGTCATYPFQAFVDLKQLFEQLPDPARLSAGAWFPESLPEPMTQFLATAGFDAALREIQDNTTSAETFRKRFFNWFNGFLAMKFIHFARDQFYGPGAITDAPAELLNRFDPTAHPDYANRTVPELLDAYRTLDRTSVFQA